VELTVLDGTLAVCRLERDAAVPGWAVASRFFSVTRTAGELSVVCEERDVPAGVAAERGWRCLEVAGPLEFGLTGIVASLTDPLARAEIPVFAISTYDTDLLLVKEDVLESAIEALEGAGHAVRRASIARRDDVEIVHAGPDRIPDLEPLWRSLHEHHMAIARRPPHVEGRSDAESWSRRRRSYERWLTEPGAFALIAERDGRPVGYAVVRLVEGSQSWGTGDRIAELETLALLPGARGSGIGTRLLDAVARELARQGVRDLSVAVAAGNDAALRFYERRGLVVTLHHLLGPA
jgi:GNAT superfamily N-acetyltransferase